jgi:hypothetical protein
MKKQRSEKGECNNKGQKEELSNKTKVGGGRSRQHPVSV